MGKDFAKRSRIVNFFGRKYQWVVGQDFHWNFLLKVTRFFASFSGLFDWIALIWVWLERSHLPAQGSCQSCPGLLKLMTSQVVQGTWLKKGGYGRFRGQYVKIKSFDLIWNLEFHQTPAGFSFGPGSQVDQRNPHLTLVASAQPGESSLILGILRTISPNKSSQL